MRHILYNAAKGNQQLMKFTPQTAPGPQKLLIRVGLEFSKVYSYFINLLAQRVTLD
jgi:hypothetical protein